MVDVDDGPDADDGGAADTVVRKGGKNGWVLRGKGGGGEGVEGDVQSSQKENGSQRDLLPYSETETPDRNHR